MKITEYFNKQNVLWFPLILDTSEGKKEPKYTNEYMPKSTDFQNLDPKEIKKRQKNTKNLRFGAVDCRIIHHIDVDHVKGETYKKEDLEFVAECKETFPYFLSSTKKQPHFLFKGDCSESPQRFQTKYEKIEVLNGAWSFFELEAEILNPLEEIPEIDIYAKGIAEKPTKKEPKKDKPPKKKAKDEGFYNDNDASNLVINLLECINNDGDKGLHYDPWTRIIWALKNDSEDNYKAALEFSERNNNHTMDSFNKIWSQGKGGNSLGTVHFYAKSHNPEKYIKLIGSSQLNCTEESLTNQFMNLEGENLIYSNNEIYIYQNEWKQDDKKHNRLKKMIRKTLNEFLIKKLMSCLNYQEQQKHFSNIHNRVQMKKTIDNIAALVCQDLACINKDVLFDVGKDQLYNIQFKNGIFDLKKKQFRPRTKYDYITKTLTWNYNPNIDKKSYQKIEDYFRKLQADPIQRKFTIGWLARCLDGDLSTSKFKTNIGYTAENGKTTEFDIHSIVFDIYSQKLSANFFSLNNDKRHKELLGLMLNPIRFSYIEELRQNKLDADFLKEFTDGNLTCEQLYSTTITRQIQATLSTCANSDFNIDMDKGVARRGVTQLYKSEFKAIYTEDNYENNTFKRDNHYKEPFRNSEGLKNAYFQILLDHRDNFYIPIENEKAFESIAEEYDEFSSAFNAVIEITNNKKDRINKTQMIELLSINKKTSWRVTLSEIKKRGIEYNKNSTYEGVRGVFYGIKQKENMNYIIEGDDEEED